MTSDDIAQRDHEPLAEAAQQHAPLPGKAPPDSAPRPCRLVAVMALLAACSFALSFGLALRLDALDVFDQYNVLFNADPNNRLPAFTDGWGGHNVRGAVHPNLANFVNPPIRLCPKLGALMWPGPQDERAVRRWLGLLLAPCAGAAQVVALCLTLYYMGLRTVGVLLVGAANVVSFSHVVFASTPEHFVLSGLAVTATFCLAAEALYRSRRVRWVPWTAAGTLLFGITVTNVVPFALVLLVVQRGLGAGQRAILRTTAKVLFLAVAVNSIWFGACYLGYREAHIARGAKTHLGYVKGGRRAVAAAARFPHAVGSGFLAPMPRIAPNRLAIRRESKYRHTFSFEKSGKPVHAPLLWLTAVVLLACVVALRWAAREARILAAASLTVLAFNWLLHSFYGHEFFLYSQHWHVCVVLLLSGALRYKAGLGRAAKTVLVAYVAVMAVSNFHVISFMLGRLAQAAAQA